MLLSSLASRLRMESTSLISLQRRRWSRQTKSRYIMSARKKLSVLVITMGCSKNLVDSEHLMRQLDTYGMKLLPSYYSLDNESNAFIDCVVINTCGFIQDAKEESISMIFKAVAAKKKNRIGKLLVFGCLSQRYMSELKEGIPEVDAFFGAFNIKDVVEYLGLEYRDELACSRYQTTPGHYAYLKISEGCNRRCAYCAIPFIRGPHISVPMEQLEKEARELAAGGVKELIVIAQDTTYYGLDLYGKRMLAPLLERLCTIDGIEWIRIHYSYPDDFPEDVIELMASENKICKYLDIPLQHCSPKVLKAMHRKSYNSGELIAFIKHIREKVPDICLRTTLLTGFPGESDKDFEALCKFVKAAKFERLGCFAYSREEGTPSYDLPNQLDDETKERRAEVIMEIQTAVSAALQKKKVGKIFEVVVEGYDNKNKVFIGRTAQDAPEIDGVVYFASPEKHCIGDFVKVKIEKSSDYDLLGTLVEEPEVEG